MQPKHEIRYYLELMKEAIDDLSESQTFKPQYIITAVKLPNGAIEIAINDKEIASKIDYILDAYDDNMHLKTNENIIMQNIMIV